MPPLNIKECNIVNQVQQLLETQGPGDRTKKATPPGKAPLLSTQTAAGFS